MSSLTWQCVVVPQDLEGCAEALQADITEAQAAAARASGEAEAAEARVRRLEAEIDRELATKVLQCQGRLGF